MRRLLGPAVTALMLVGCAQHPVAATHPRTTSQPSASPTVRITTADTVSPAVPRATTVTVAGVIPWIDAPAPASPPPTPLPARPLPRNSPACSAAQVTVRDLGSSGRTQDRGSVLQFTNSSRRTCLLFGRPRIILWGPGFGPTRLTQPNNEDPGTSFDMPPGQTTLLWLSAQNDCLSGAAYRSTPIVDRLSIALDGGGDVVVRGLKMPRTCGGIGESSFYRQTPEARYALEPLAGAAVSLDLPQGPVRAGSVYSYVVVVRNPTKRALTMLPCPGYTQGVSVGTAVDSALQLNCQGRTSLPAGAALSFQMELTIPEDAPTGPATIGWQLADIADKHAGRRPIQLLGNDIPCQAGQLRASAPDPAVAFAGSGTYEVKDSGTALTVVLTNTSSALCTLQGAPTVAATGSDGRSLQLRFGERGFNGYQPPPPQTRLAPGAQSRTVLSWHAKWCGRDPNPVTVTLGLPAGGEVTVTPAHGWAPPGCIGWDFPYNVSSTDLS